MSAPRRSDSFRALTGELARAFDRLGSRRVVLFGGKGGVGKTTLASLAALHTARSSDTVLFSTDPASNLRDLFADREGTDGTSAAPRVHVETIDAAALWRRFLDDHLEQFVELGDRGTYLDRDEIRALFELSIPGIDELMGWMRIGELAEERPGARLVVDTAPTGHTLRLLGSSSHFTAFAEALEQMQAKHTALVVQLARRRPPDPLDEFLRRFRARFERYRDLLTDASTTAFVPVLLAEPWVTAQTVRLIEQVRRAGIDVPLAILNQARHACDCASCRAGAQRERDAAAAVGLEVVRAPRACVPLHSLGALAAYLDGEDRREPPDASRSAPARPLALPPAARLLFFAGKGGVGKTTTASSVALQLAARDGSRPVTLISVDPAHSVLDVFARIEAPPNLTVETVDTRRRWERLRERLGDEIERAVRGLTAPNIRLAHDSDVLRELVEIAPPGADEIFAIMRLAELLDDPDRTILVDTAPTGHFLRLLELPETAGAWVREMMRLLLRYRELVPPGSLGEELLEASKALKRLTAALGSGSPSAPGARGAAEAAVVLVSRPERLVANETKRLRAELERRGIAIAATVVNAVTPAGDCGCEQSRRSAEMEIVREIGGDPVLVPRTGSPPVDAAELRALIPLE